MYATGSGRAKLQSEIEGPFCLKAWYHATGSRDNIGWFTVTETKTKLERSFHSTVRRLYFGTWHQVTYSEDRDGSYVVSKLEEADSLIQTLLCVIGTTHPERSDKKSKIV